jgi:imidazolonepropionase-like amidohydrolase
VRITAHCFEEESVAVLVRAGIDCVEHGTGLAPEVIDEMARRGTALVPTMLNIATLGDVASRASAKFPVYAEHMLALMNGFPALVRQA